MTEPAPVEVVNPDPLPVTVHAATDTDDQAAAKRVAASAKVEAAALTTAGQRRVSIIWERTQQIIALSVVEVTLAVAGWKAVDADSDTVAFVFLASVSNLVIGFYFGRTNHQRVGSDPGEVTGR